MNETTLQKMKQMKLHGMTAAFKASLEDGRKVNLTADELISFLVDAEWDDRNNRRVARRIKMARFRYKANIEQIDFSVDRNLDKNLMNRFAECNFIDKHENILITGSTGIGKSYIASALGNHACTLGYKVFYAGTSKLFAMLKMAKADGSYIKEIAKIEKADLLILDEATSSLDTISEQIVQEAINNVAKKSTTIIVAHRLSTVRNADIIYVLEKGILIT